MTLELNVHDDFSTVIDGFEAITLKRRDSSETIEVSKAWRFSSDTEAASEGVAEVARHDVIWQFPWEASADRPRLGDLIIDATNDCWTIQSVSELGAKTRLRCLARNLYLVHAIDDRVDIQQAIWEDSGDGPEIVGWTTLRSAVPARIQPDRTTVETSESDPPTLTAAYRVVLGEQFALDHNHRIVGPDGAVYQLVEYLDAERMDTLPTARVTKLTGP